MGSTKLITEKKIPILTFEQSLVSSKVKAGIILSDDDYKIVIKDCLGVFGVIEFSDSSKSYEYVKFKYGNLNIDRLNRTLKDANL